MSEASLSVCQDRFPENNDYKNVWTTFVFESLDPRTTGEPECAIRCMLHPNNKCHFYAFINGRCYFGDFNNPHRNVLNSDFASGTMKMFQPPLSGKYKDRY